MCPGAAAPVRRAATRPVRQRQPGSGTLAPVRVGLIGTGLMALHHLDTMVGREDTVVAAMCEPSPAAYDAAAAKVEAAGGPRPPNEPDWRRFIGRSRRASSSSTRS